MSAPNFCQVAVLGPELCDLGRSDSLPLSICDGRIGLSRQKAAVYVLVVLANWLAALDTVQFVEIEIVGKAVIETMADAGLGHAGRKLAENVHAGSIGVTGAVGELGLCRPDGKATSMFRRQNCLCDPKQLHGAGPVVGIQLDWVERGRRRGATRTHPILGATCEQ
jgi:hypothetical protein